jgi:threonine dehydrogenase-like Zn-dependent dehydrogenase
MEPCLQPLIMGSMVDGAWAEYIAVPTSCLVAVPDHLPIEQAAILADAVATPFAGLLERSQLRAGESVGLWGIGGLGTHAVQIARMVGATPIIAVDPDEAARGRALDLGADHALDPGAVDVKAQVMRLTDGQGLDLAVDLAGLGGSLAQAASCLAIRGRVVMIGLGPEPVQLEGPGFYLGVAQQSLLGHLGYSKLDLERLVRLVATGRLDLSRSISDVLPLEDVAEGVERLVTKKGHPVRILVKP